MSIEESQWILHSLDSDKYLALITTLGTLSSCTVIISPMGFMIKALSGGVDSNSAICMVPTIVMMFAQAALWGCFGFVTLHVSICHVNAFGALMAAIYLRILTEATKGSDRRHVECIFYGVIISTALFCIGLLTFVNDSIIQQNVLSNLAIFFNIGLFVAPIGQLFEIFETRKIDSFPIGLTVCGFVSSLLWAEYSLMISSIPYLIPNIIGVACNGTSILFYGYMYLRSSKDGAHLPLVDKKDTCPGYSATERYKRALEHSFMQSKRQQSDDTTSTGIISSSDETVSCDEDFEREHGVSRGDTGSSL